MTLDRVDRVLGLGSPYGDDQVGWRVAQRLAERGDVSATVVALPNPTQTLDYFEGALRLVIVDGCQSGAAPGTIYRWKWPEAPLAPRQMRSTHGVELDAALRLAQSLQWALPQVVLYCIECESCRLGEDLTPAVAHAAVKLERRIVQELNSQEAPGYE